MIYDCLGITVIAVHHLGDVLAQKMGLTIQNIDHLGAAGDIFIDILDSRNTCPAPGKVRTS